MSSFDALWSELEPLGRHPGTGGYRRYAYDSAELDCREWFTAAAQTRGLDLETDRNGNIWAWWVPSLPPWPRPIPPCWHACSYLPTTARQCYKKAAKCCRPFNRA